MISFFKKTVASMSATRNKISNLLTNATKSTSFDEAYIQKIEGSLLGADLGWELTEYFIDEIRVTGNKKFPDNLINIIKSYLNNCSKKKELNKIILIVGINGTGKTTTAAKLGNYFIHNGELVTFVAADTYRAAAIDQIKIWAERLKVHVVSNDKSSDPASIAYDGISSGLSKSADRIIIDTSGRMNTSLNLMKELEKIYKVSSKLSEDIDILITIDANSGQNAFQQVKDFKNYLPLTGIIMTKMDGTAKGGIVLQIIKKLNLPIYFMGVGEKIDDLIPFDEDDYICSLFKDKEKINNE